MKTTNTKKPRLNRKRPVVPRATDEVTGFVEGSSIDALLDHEMEEMDYDHEKEIDFDLREYRALASKEIF